MDKTNFLWILEAALLSFDGASFIDLVSIYGISPNIAKAGMKLYEYLNSTKKSFYLA